MSQRTTRSKRLIEKDNAVVLRAPTIAQTADVIYTADRSLTLVRIVGNLMVGNVSATPNNTSIVIVLQPAGYNIRTVSTTSLEQIYTAMKDVLWGRAVRSSAILNTFVDVDIDVKGMRKMRDGDILVMAMKSTADAAHSVFGQVTMFFKES